MNPRSWKHLEKIESVSGNKVWRLDGHDEREMWVMNDPYLYDWAQREGVDV